MRATFYVEEGPIWVFEREDGLTMRVKPSRVDIEWMTVTATRGIDPGPSPEELMEWIWPGSFEATVMQSIREPVTAGT